MCLHKLVLVMMLCTKRRFLDGSSDNIMFCRVCDLLWNSPCDVNSLHLCHALSSVLWWPDCVCSHDYLPLPHRLCVLRLYDNVHLLNAVALLLMRLHTFFQ